MSETLERGAELIKLARLLDVERSDLQFLDTVSSTALREFRDQVADRLFSGDAVLQLVASSSKLIPVPLTAKIAQIAFGPMLCAAVAGLLEPDRAAKIAARVPTPFLGDIAVHLDPRRAAAVIAAVPTPVVVKVAKELVDRGEHVTMGRFVNFLSRETLAAAVPQIPDDADLLKIAFVMEGKDSLDDLYDIARDRIVGLIRTAYEQDMWAEALDLISHLNVANRAELGDLAATQDADLLNSLVRAAQRMGVWEVLLPVIAQMSPAGLSRLARVPAVLETGVLHDVAQAALTHDMWLDLLPLSKYLEPAARKQIADFAAEQSEDKLQEMAASAHDADMWEAMLPIAAALPNEVRTQLARMPLLQRSDVLVRIVATVGRTGLWDELLPLADVLPAEQRPDLAAAIAGLTPDQLRDALEAALRTDSLLTLARFTMDQPSAGRRAVLRELMPVAAGLPAADLATFAALEVIHEPSALSDVILTIAEHDLWSTVLPLVEALPASARTHLAACLGELDREQMLAGLTAAARADNLPSLVEIALAQNPAGRVRVLQLVVEAGRLEDFTALLTRATPDDVWVALTRERHDMPDPVRLAIRTRAAELNRAEVVELLAPTGARRSGERPPPRPRAQS